VKLRWFVVPEKLNKLVTIYSWHKSNKVQIGMKKWGWMKTKWNEYEMRWNNKAWSVLESGLRRYPRHQSWDSSWCSYVKPDLKLRGLPAACTIRSTCASRTIVIIYEKSDKDRPVHRSSPARYFNLFCLSGLAHAGL